jgi:hypothetical protein
MLFVLNGRLVAKMSCVLTSTRQPNPGIASGAVWKQRGSWPDVKSLRGPEVPISRAIAANPASQALAVLEISNIRWSMVTDAQGAVTDTIHLVNDASKGKRGGRGQATALIDHPESFES